MPQIKPINVTRQPINQKKNNIKVAIDGLDASSAMGTENDWPDPNGLITAIQRSRCVPKAQGETDD